jgi:peptidoglycan/LPS O-acetylase OafA/YrhL
MAAVPDALTPPPGNPRFPLFDALRAIAALSVVVTHAAGLSGFNGANPVGGLTARMNIGVTISS